MTEAQADAWLLHLAETCLLPDRPADVGVAVSGGGDSMALLHLMAAAAPKAGWRLHAVTVDHGLRPEAAAEARMVADACAALGIAHDTRHWHHDEIKGNLQDAARRARYGLIADWARARGIGHVAVGHTADDVAETFLMELAREAGIDGLSAIRSQWQAGGIRWHRPFRLVARADLRAWLTRHGIGWAEDPSNIDPKYQRVRARRALEALAPLGITAGRLTGVALNLAQARQALDWAVAEAGRRIAREVAGEVILDRGEFRLLPPEIARRMLVAALGWVNSAPYPPRGAEVQRVLRAIEEGRDSTLAGCCIRARGDEVRITREPRAVQGLSGPTDAPWDGRWIVEGPHAPGLEVRALGAEGLGQCEGWRDTGASRQALVVSPALWQGERLVAAPLARPGPQWQAYPAIPLQSALAAH